MNDVTTNSVRRLLASATAEDDDDKLIELLGAAVDDASDLGSEGELALAIGAIDRALAKNIKASTAALLNYFQGGAWGSLRHLRQRDFTTAWDWESLEHEQEIFRLRCALGHPGFRELEISFQCRVLTNLANVLSNIGSYTRALAYYDRALELDPEFGMALGNKGICLLTYARDHYEPGHQCVFSGHAAQVLEKALGSFLENPSARAGFSKYLEIAKNRYGDHACADHEAVQGHSLGETDDERSFRSWCLRHRLFLNPLNDLGPIPIASWDYLVLPTVVVRAEVGTAFHGFYNQLKQEYATARWLYYEGTELALPRHADLELNLLDTLDRSVFGVRLEKIKVALRSAYSLFDKIAEFIVQYLGIDATKTYFRWFWYEGNGRQRRLRSSFAGKQNLALRALFWLSKDLVDARTNGAPHSVLEPDAQQIALIRNKLEHGYLKVLSSVDLWTPPAQVPPDPFAHRIREDELRTKTLHVLRLARSALIYLVLAVHQEERSRVPIDPSQVFRSNLKPIR